MVNEVALRLLVAWQGLKARFEDEHGQTLAEYGLIMAVIAVAVVVAAGVAFRSAIIGAFDGATECISGAGSTGPCS
jgi:Flp pilus assembly pilin Flp